MKTIKIYNEIFNVNYPDLTVVSERLDKQGEGHFINVINWEKYPYNPEVWFNIAYSDREIFLKYYVSEDYFKAEKTESNLMVCEDSCVEFFVSPENDGIYYNFEFNAIGTCLLGTGTSRENNSLAPTGIISKIRRMTSLTNKPVKEKRGKFEWNITLAIAYEVFFHHKINNLKGKTFRANFYKCGDKLEVPHYLTWNPVGTADPDYHQPQYFGTLKFI
jgi:hypothetical protein